MTPFNLDVLAQALFKESGDGLFVFDPETGQVLAVNPVGINLTGFTERELLKMQSSYLIRSEAKGNMNRLKQAAQHTAVFHSQEGFLLRTKQEPGWTPVNLTMSRLHVQPRTLGLVTVRDIREQRESHARLQQMEAELRRVVASVSDCLWSAEADSAGIWSYRYFSPVVEKITGLPPDKLLGGLQAWRNLVHPEDRPVFEGAVARLKSGHPSREEYRIVRPDRSVCWVRDSAQVGVGAGGRTMQIAGVITDITPQRNLEDQLRHAQKMEAIGRLAGGVAHDFNNLLTVIKGFSELLSSGLGPSHPLFGAAQQIDKASDRAVGLTAQLLTFSRRNVSVPKVLDLNAQIGDTELMLRKLLNEDVELTVVPGPNLARVKADPGQIDQVLINLAINARDAMPGGGKFTVQTSNVILHPDADNLPPDVKPGRYVLLTVTDTGCGMSREVQSRIFEPFFTTKEFGKGTGLGLSIVYGIVKQHQGHIDVVSQPGEGTTFRVFLPPAEEPMPVPGVVVRPKGASRPGVETILLVEDEEMVRNFAAMTLQQRGYYLIQAGSGMEALRAAEQHGKEIDLLVTDVVMPQMNGVTLCKLLRQARPHLQVLYMSGYTGGAIDHLSPHEVETAFISKPFSPDLLLRKVRELLDVAARPFCITSRPAPGLENPSQARAARASAFQAASPHPDASPPRPCFPSDHRAGCTVRCAGSAWRRTLPGARASGGRPSSRRCGPSAGRRTRGTRGTGTAAAPEPCRAASARS